MNSADSYDGSPMRNAAAAMPFMSSPVLISSPPVSPRGDSPPMSPMAQSLSRSLGSSSINEMVASLRLGKMKSMPPNRNIQMGSPGFGSPRGSMLRLRPGFCSLPTTPTQAPVPGRSGVSYFDLWDQDLEEEPVMERVESGSVIRAKMFEKLSKENSLDRSGSDSGQTGGAPDVGWVSELVK